MCQGPDVGPYQRLRSTWHVPYLRWWRRRNVPHAAAPGKRVGSSLDTHVTATGGSGGTNQSKMLKTSNGDCIWGQILDCMVEKWGSDDGRRAQRCTKALHECKLSTSEMSSIEPTAVRNSPMPTRSRCPVRRQQQCFSIPRRVPTVVIYQQGVEPMSSLPGPCCIVDIIKEHGIIVAIDSSSFAGSVSSFIVQLSDDGFEKFPLEEHDADGAVPQREGGGSE
ncbi:hypothetical protein EDD85DRAFT_931110 [Armillaria nabsnona]|nr:hypothetical protein EDD85DRAFT_931110 [Armillaria nabsnona]